jgi:hypothetical protein
VPAFAACLHRLREFRGTAHLDNPVDASPVHRIGNARTPIGMLSIIDNITGAQRPGSLQLLV